MDQNMNEAIKEIVQDLKKKYFAKESDYKGQATVLIKHLILISYSSLKKKVRFYIVLNIYFVDTVI